MSQENVELVQRLYERWGRGDRALDVLDPDFDLTMAAGRPDEARFHGHAGWVEFVRDWVGTWHTYRVETDEYIDAGDDVLVRLREVGKLHETGPEVSQTGTAVLTIREGLVIRYRGFVEHKEALEAVGMRE
jgi:ketosteroid isomerase-like protein